MEQFEINYNTFGNLKLLVIYKNNRGNKNKSKNKNKFGKKEKCVFLIFVGGVGYRVYSEFFRSVSENVFRILTDKKSTALLKKENSHKKT